MLRESGKNLRQHFHYSEVYSFLHVEWNHTHFRLVHVYDKLKDRRIDDVIMNLFLLFVKYICNRLSGFGKFDIPCINTCYLTTDYLDSFKWNTRYAVRSEKKVYEMVGHTSASSVTQG